MTSTDFRSLVTRPATGPSKSRTSSTMPESAAAAAGASASASEGNHVVAVLVDRGEALARTASAGVRKCLPSAVSGCAST